MTESTESRLQKLETANRRMKIGGVAALGMMGMFLLTAMVQDPSVQDIRAGRIEARELVIDDGSVSIRTADRVSILEPGVISLVKTDSQEFGEPPVQEKALVLDFDGLLVTEDGAPRAGIGQFLVPDEDGRRVALPGPTFLVFDEDGQIVFRAPSR